MQAEELKKKAKKAKKVDLVNALMMLYQRFPAKQSEELDASLTAILEGRKQKKTVDFATLENEIDTFITNIKMGYYYKPNRVVSKDQQSRWRFEASKYVKGLLQITVDDANYEIANTMLLDLFSLFGASYIYDLFRSHNAFKSLRIKESDFYKQIVERMVNASTNVEELKRLIKAACETIVNDDTLNIELFYELNDVMNEKQKKESIPICVSLMESLEKRRQNHPRQGRTYEEMRMPMTRQINTLLREKLCLESSLGLLSEDSFKYYFDHTTHDHLRNAFFYALNDLRPFTDEELIHYYHYGIEQWHIPSTNALRKLYENAMNHLKQENDPSKVEE